MENKGTKITINREKDHPCYGCAYAMKRPDKYMTILSPWFVCTKPIQERKEKIIKLSKQLVSATENWLDCLIAGHRGDNAVDDADDKLAAINCELDAEMDIIREIIDCGWVEPVKMTIISPDCHTEHRLPLLSYKEGRPLPLSADLVPTFGQTTAPVFMKGEATDNKVYMSAAMGNGWDLRILYAVKDGFFASDPDDHMAYADVVEYDGAVTVENWKKFWEGRGYKVYFNKEL